MTADSLQYRVDRLEKVVEDSLDEIKEVVKEIRDINKTTSAILAKHPMVDDHETRLRVLEQKLASLPEKKDFEEIQKFIWKALGIISAVSFLGFPTVAYLLIHAGK